MFETNKKNRLVGLVLAAGSAKRFKGNKLQATYDGNRRVGIESAAKLASILPSTVVICSPRSDTAVFFKEAGFNTVEAAYARLGMGYSLRAGVCATRDAAGWVVALADMPFIDIISLRKVVASLNCPERIVVPTFRGTYGHPVGFGKLFEQELKSIRDDKGAKSVIERYPELVKRIEVSDKGVITDIDTIQDLRNAETNYT